MVKFAGKELLLAVIKLPSINKGTPDL